MDMNLSLPGNPAGGESITLADETFAREYNEPLVHQAVVSYLAGARQGTAKQKSRAEVRGGGRKPRRQKGSGMARVGTIRSPIWRGGGVTFAARHRDYAKKLNRKMYRGAMGAILSELIRQERLIVVSEFQVESHKTAALLERLRGFSLDGSLVRVLVVADEVGENLYLASRNLHKVEVADVAALNPVGLIGSDKVLITVAALRQIEKALA